MAQSRIIELARIISKNASLLEHGLVGQNLPTPTFDPTVTVAYPSEVALNRDAIIDATQELNDLLHDPMLLIHRKSSHNNMACMKAIVRYNIADCLQTDETKTYAELAESCGLSEKPLKHLLRHAMTMRIFKEPSKDVVAHTSASNLMRDPNCKAWLDTGTDELWPSSVRLVDALQKWPDSEEPSHSGWNIAHNIEEPLYRHFAVDTKRATRFGAAMTAMIANNPAFDSIHLHRSFDWESLGSGLVVDIGGSHGAISVSLAERFPVLSFVSQDLVSTIESAAPVPPELSDRVQLTVHDFFTPQPVEADAYLFRWIFHNHSDKYAIMILKALIPALKPGARILVQDGCLPDPGTIPNWREKDVRDIDLTMKTYFNAWERDLTEWKELFAKADSRFNFIGMTQPQGSALALLEVRWERPTA